MMKEAINKHVCSLKKVIPASIQEIWHHFEKWLTKSLLTVE